MKTKTKDTIIINLLQSEGESRGTFEIPSCAKCEKACKKCRLAFMMNLESEQNTINQEITVSTN